MLGALLSKALRALQLLGLWLLGQPSRGSFGINIFLGINVCFSCFQMYSRKGTEGIMFSSVQSLDLCT